MAKKEEDEGLDLDGFMDDLDDEVGRIRTYINGFDEQLGGGIPVGHVVLVSGTAGTMKSSLTFYLQYHNAKNNGLKGLYVSLEQNKTSLIRHMKGLGMDIEDVEENLNIWDLGMIRTGLLEGESWLKIFKKDLMDYKNKVGLDLLVIDSLPVMDLIAKWDDPRTELFHLFEWLRELDVTALLISEISVGEEKYGKHEEDFLADGILLLKMYEQDEVSVSRRIRCVKMRNTDHTMNNYTLLFEDGNFEITRVIGKDS